MITGLRRVTKAGFVGFWRNGYVSFSSVFVMTVALFVIVCTMILDQLLSSVLVNLQSRVDINVYFVTAADETEILALRASLEALPDVAQVTYTSREEALARFREQNRGNTISLQALDELNENPFGANLAVQARETSQYEFIAQFIEEQDSSRDLQSSFIERINYTDTREAIDRLSTIIGAVERGSLLTLLVLVGAAVLITFNTIRLAIYTSREEIAVMRLVGASNWFIRGPFMLQGVMYGLVSGLLALLAVYPLLVWIGPQTADFFEFNAYTYFIQDFSSILLTIVGIGVALGLASSTLAVARYLKI